LQENDHQAKQLPGEGEQQEQPGRIGEGLQNGERLKLDQSCSVRAFRSHLFPNWRYTGWEYSIRFLNGEPGDGVKIRLSGLKMGLWKDFVSDERGND
jgi:hypothetical protein